MYTLFFHVFSYGLNIENQTWPNISRAMRGMGVGTVLSLIDLILALPPTSVANEAAFSQLKLMKTDRRHRLGEGRLQDLMMIRLNSAEIDNFNPDEAINIWSVSLFVHFNSNYMILILVHTT
jgi:hypothetical protein